MTRLAPPHLVGLVLGVWFLAAAWGNKLAGILGSGYTATDPQALAIFFLQQAAMVGVATLALLLLVPVAEAADGRRALTARHTPRSRGLGVVFHQLVVDRVRAAPRSSRR